MDLELPKHVREGDILAGKYRVERILGAGGMGVVVAAKHLQLNQRVAIKFLLPHCMGNAEVVGRFMREAQAAVRIKSEHVARVLDVGNLETGAPYMVIEYLDGRDLGSWLAQKGVLPVEQAVDFVLQAMEAIAEAHSLGIIHRDLKPANLYCVRSADAGLRVKVLDFGISKIQDSRSLDLTRTSTVIGSPFYMSPEQLRSSRDVDQRADIWSLGVILFQLLGGKPPFTAGGLPELVIKITSQPTPLVRTLRPDVPPRLDQIIGRCLEKEREQRYSNVAELAVALAPFGPAWSARNSAERIVRILQNKGVSINTLTAYSEPARNPGSIPIEAAWGNTASPSNAVRRWLPVGIAAMAGVTALGTFTWSVFRSPPADEAMPALRSAVAMTSFVPSPGVTVPSVAPPNPPSAASNAVPIIGSSTVVQDTLHAPQSVSRSRAADRASSSAKRAVKPNLTQSDAPVVS